MITEKQFNHLWYELCQNWNKSYNLSVNQKNLFYKHIKDLPYNLLEQNINYIIQNNQYFPTIYELKNPIIKKTNSKEILPKWLENPELCKFNPISNEEQQELSKLIEDLTL